MATRALIRQLQDVEPSSLYPAQSANASHTHAVSILAHDSTYLRDLWRFRLTVRLLLTLNTRARDVLHFVDVSDRNLCDSRHLFSRIDLFKPCQL